MSPQGYFDKVVDDKGNEYNLSEIIAGESYQKENGVLTTNTLLCTAGIFELYFETGSGMENTSNAIENLRRAVLCQVFQDYSDFINTPLKTSGKKVKIWIRNPTSLSPPMPSNAAGAASAFYLLPINNAQANLGNFQKRGGIADNEIWKTIHTGKNSYENTAFPLITDITNTGFYHGMMSINFAGSFSWNLDYNKYDLATGFQFNQIDLYTTVLHEVTHLLGFSSLIRADGFSVLPDWNLTGFNIFYSRYDKFLRTFPAGLNLIANDPVLDGQMYNFKFQTTLLNNLSPNCTTPPEINNYNCSNRIRYQGTSSVPIYNPGCYQNGSSLSHFEDACFNNINANNQYFLMSEASSAVKAKRFLQPEERQTLCDIGYSMKSVFGSASNFTFKNYAITDCTGITIAGINDGFTAATGYQYEGNSSTDIIISGFLANDYTDGQLSNLRYEFAQDIYDPTATIVNQSGSASTNIIFKSYASGVHLIRYVPYDIVTGQRGNITYIFVNVKNNCTIENSCSLVRNGNFEEHITPPDFHSQLYKACGWINTSFVTTADYFNSNAPTVGPINVSVPCNLHGNKNDNIANNKGYVGMFINNLYNESIKTELITSMLPNTTYRLSFDVAIAEKYSTRAAKIQAFITDENFNLCNLGLIPVSKITANTVFLTNNTFSTSSNANATGWETITFNFTTPNNPNLKYLYIGGLNNVQLTIQPALPIPPSCNIGPVVTNDTAFYYLDNVNLSVILPSNYLDAINDNFTSMPINTITGGVTTSVFGNDLFNTVASTITNTNNVYISLQTPLAIAGATITDTGLINIPPNTPVGTYTFTYKIQLKGSCSVYDTATVTLTIVNTPVTPNLSTSTRANNIVEICKLQSTGKIIISGTFTTYNNITKNRFCRLNNNLTLDQTFTSTGATSHTQRPNDMAIQTDDKIVVVGTFTSFGGATTSQNVCRLMPNGSPDTNFNVGGVGTAKLNKTTLNEVYACAIQSDGKILVGGDFYYYNGIKRLGIVRLLITGAIDSSFDPIQINDNYRSIVTKILLQPDGKILLQGFFNYSDFPQWNLIRLNTDGSIDNTFNKGNTVGSAFLFDISTSLRGPLANMVLQTDGKIIIVGAFTKYNNNTVNNIARLMSDGQIDTSFTISSGTNRAINDLLIESNSGKIIIGGEFTTFDNTSVKKMLRLTTSGAIDNSFNIGTGTATTSIANPGFSANMVKCLLKQTDNKIIVGGRYMSFNGLTAGNITRIYGDSGYQAKGGNGFEMQSEAEIDTNMINSVTVYPNPSDGIITLDLRNELIPYNKLTIINVLGKVVFTANVVPHDIYNIDLTNYSNGCYFAKLESESQSTTIKIIKN